MLPNWSLIAIVLISLSSLSQVEATPLQAPMLPSCNKPFTPFVYKGCFTDTGRNLHGYQAWSNDYGFGIIYNSKRVNMLPDECVAFCKGNMFRFAGLRQNGECFCGTYLEDTKQELGQMCNFRCIADKSKFCGGRVEWDIYEDPTYLDYHIETEYTNLGCWSVQAWYPQMLHAVRRMKTSECLAICKQGRYPFAMLRSGMECFCDYQLRPIEDGAYYEAVCNAPCRGEPSETCGSQNGYPNIYYASDFQGKELCVSDNVEQISEFPPTAFNYTERETASDSPPAIKPFTKWPPAPIETEMPRSEASAIVSAALALLSKRPASSSSTKSH